jgi:hypothetical protein
LVVLGTTLAVAAIQQSRTDATRARDTASRKTDAQGRAVFGEASEPGQTQPHKADQGRRERTLREDHGGLEANSTRANGDVPSDIRAFLDEWTSTFIHGDIEGHVNLYAPRVDKFFLKRHVSRAAVRAEKVRMLRRYPRFERYEVRDIKVDRVTPDQAVVTFRKDWDARGLHRFAGSELQRLTLSRRSGAWQIVSEQEPRVFWVRRG